MRAFANIHACSAILNSCSGGVELQFINGDMLMFRRALRAAGWWFATGVVERLKHEEQTPELASLFERLIARLDEARSAQTNEQFDMLRREVGAIADTIQAHYTLAKGISLETLAREYGGRIGDSTLVANLARFFSQSYEDGIIAEIFRRIGTTSKTFIEIGVGDGTENNTRFLLSLGWNGLWIDSDPNGMEEIRRRFAQEIADGRLSLVHDCVTKDNVNALIARAGMPSSVDFFSLDIDMNTSHVWRAIEVEARASCIEYNAHYPPSVEFEVPYHPESRWDGSRFVGALLKTLQRIGSERGLSLVACELMGANAFFVRKDLADVHFRGVHEADIIYQPLRYHWFFSDVFLKRDKILNNPFGR
jgi:hypothetical protein